MFSQLFISDFWFIILQRSLFSNPILDHLSFLLYARWLNLSLSLNYFIFLLFLHSVTRWLDHLLKIWLFYYKEKWPNSKFLLPKQVQNLPNTNQTLKILPKASRILPKWRNFTKSGHTFSVKNKQKGQRQLTLKTVKMTRYPLDIWAATWRAKYEEVVSGRWHRIH